MLQNCYQTELLEAGCDEAGRGCLAGPVFAAAVILPPDFYHPLLNDSKKMTQKDRLLLRDIICEQAVAWVVEGVTAERIDKINILNASIEAMNKAIKGLNPRPQFLAIDGNRFTNMHDIPYKCIVKGDAKYANIAAASVLAKTFRDEYMCQIANDYPCYYWKKNKGYPTREHRKGIAKFGLSPFHRKTFSCLTDEELTLF